MPSDSQDLQIAQQSQSQLQLQPLSPYLLLPAEIRNKIMTYVLAQVNVLEASNYLLV